MTNPPNNPQTAWMQTFSGRKFHPLSPDPAEVRIEDIAHHLSLICRYNGATPYHYSVAQHSVYVAALMEPGEQIHGLLHDAAEAYFGDIIRPIKHQFPHFNLVEDRILDAIYEALNIQWPRLEPFLDERVKAADNVALACEARDMFPNRPDEWTLPEPATDSLIISEFTPLGAEEAFLGVFTYLINGHAVRLETLPGLASAVLPVMEVAEVIIYVRPKNDPEAKTFRLNIGAVNPAEWQLGNIVKLSIPGDVDWVIVQVGD